MSRTASPLRDRVVFLVGVRRSGTNWLRRIVDAHPDASVIPAETYLFSHGIAPLRDRVQHGLAGSARTGTMFVDRGEFLDAVRDLCDRLLGSHLDTLDHPVRLLAERTPDHVRVLDLVVDVYPDASVVHIVRDGRDVVLLVSQPWGPQSHVDAAREWVTGIEAARRHATDVARYREMSYEALLADPAREVPVLYRFLGLDDSDAVVRDALREADVPYNVDPAAARVEVAKWRGGLDPDQLAEVLEVAGPLLRDLGYDVEQRGERRRGSLVGLRSVARRTAAAPTVVRRRLDETAFQRELLARFDASMAVLDDLLADAVAGRFDDLGRHFGPDARIRVVDGADSWDLRGDDAVRRLAAVWAADPALRGRQLRGDVHPGVPTFTVVTTWEADGVLHDRVMVVTRYGPRIGELVWYVLPRTVPTRRGGEA